MCNGSWEVQKKQKQFLYRKHIFEQFSPHTCSMGGQRGRIRLPKYRIPQVFLKEVPQVQQVVLQPPLTVHSSGFSINFQSLARQVVQVVQQVLVQH